MESKWISVHDKMPDNRRNVICKAGNSMAIFQNRCGTWHIDDENIRFPIVKITHWCEIPPVEIKEEIKISYPHIDTVKKNIIDFQKDLFKQIKDFEISNHIEIKQVQSIVIESKFEPNEFTFIGLKFKIEL